MLDHGEALALQRSADVLLLLTAADTSAATGKIFEYLGAGRPIIALARESNQAAQIVRETNTGVAVAPDDRAAIGDALRLAASGELQRRYAPRNIERYNYPGPAQAMAELVEEAIARKASRDPDYVQ
jgi:hypothetical protein